MGLLDIFSYSKKLNSLNKSNKKINAELSDIKAQLLKSIEENASLSYILKNKRVNIQKPIQYSSQNIVAGGSKRHKAPYTGPVYDLGEITRALDVESYLAISVRKHREQILKEGWDLVGDDQEAIDYIKKRLFEFAIVSGITFDEVLREFTTNLIQYATTFIVLARDSEASSGSRNKWKGKKQDPIAAIFPMNPVTVSVQQNSAGHVVRWKQTVKSPSISADTTTRDFEASDVVVATIDKKSGFVFGTPYIMPVLDDVRVLRRIEEISEVVAQRHAFPWIHWKVGTDLLPAEVMEDGTPEIDIVKSVILSTPPEGGVITDHRVEADVLGAKDHAIDLVPYLEYYESRVMAGLRLSPEDLGRSEGSKGGAQTASKTLQEASKDFQAVISNAITYQLFVPLLLEGGFDVTQETLVRLEFQLIDREEERARVSHGNDLFLSGSITRNELRKEYLKRKEMSDEEDADTIIGRKEKHELDLAKLSAQAKKDKQAESAKKKSSNTTRPSNQSGKKPAKTRIRANDSAASILYNKALQEQWSDTKLLLEDFVSKYTGKIEADTDDLCDISSMDTELSSILDTLVIFFSSDSKALLMPIISAGAAQAAADTDKDIYVFNNRSIDRFIKNNVSKTLNNFVSSIKGEILASESIFDLDSVNPQLALTSLIDNRTDELLSLGSKHTDIAYRFGYVKAIKAYGYDKVTLSPIEDCVCEECYEVGDKEISLLNKDIPYNILLYTHSNCEFEIKI